MLFLEGQDLETWVVPDGFLHPGAAFSGFEGERANLDVHEKPCVEMRLKSHRNGKIETTCVSNPRNLNQLLTAGSGWGGIPPGFPLGSWGLLGDLTHPLSLGAGMSSGREREGEGRQQ